MTSLPAPWLSAPGLLTPWLPAPGIPTPGPLAAWLLDAAAVLAPVSCGGCGVDGRSVCVRCRDELVPSLREVDLGGLRATAALDYGGVVSSLLSAAKEHDRPGVLRALAPPFRAAVDSMLARESEPVLVVAVPSSAQARRARGYRPVETLVRLAGRRPAPSGVLRQIREVDDQAGLSVAARRRNLSGALRAGPMVQGRCVLLVDDVVTTGSTLREAARAVSEAQGAVVGAACLAHTVKRKATPR
ncbi:phosphoribosyltransferase family protein [Herbiconiux sp. KACC 21604]|uniref:ComF family protein n=1 Tax=unclassified Herbiconiux TaxID=2618217 RepID=UPI00149135E3|nr:phosphoribosyltransferase family protein [Herbiconiux sp. SALV-R1]QJU54393.1 ComF family protein [Herbiconiux sp. SALV-R1]WPO85465.1 phosphoribosyltransferase family protein [Herbiconiux sp. KACC 21604]